MLAKCSNPGCQAPFDYREGRLMRFSETQSTDQPAEAKRLIRHFWLCGKCSALYMLECDLEMTLKLKLRHEEPAKNSLSCFSCAA